MSKKIMGVLLVALMLVASCAPHSHIVGDGAQGHASVTMREIYVINLIPLKEIDSKDLAGDAANYTIDTKVDFLGVVVQLVTGGIITSRTVTVTK